MSGIEFEFEFEASRPGRGRGRGGRLRRHGRARSGRARGLVLWALLLAAGPVSGQAGGGDGAGQGDTIRVGDVVPVPVRVTVERGERVVWPDTLPLAGAALENAARVREMVDTLADGRLERTGVYAVTPWRTGELALPEVRVQVVGGTESPRVRTVALPPLVVRSVLPADTAGVEPRPARGVLGASWDWGTILLLAGLVALALAALVWWWLRRRVGREEPVAEAPRVPPRERALAVLQEARDSGLLERGEVKEFYVRWSNAVRDYVAALEPVWGEDLTTTELLSRFRAQVGIGETESLRSVLGPADQVKFARRVPDRDTAVAEWESARAWVLGFDWPPRVREEAA